MANQITDQRTLIFDGGDGTGGQPDTLAGTATGTTDTSTFIEGSTSYTISASNSLVGMLFDAGSDQDYSNETFWLWVNSGVVGLMETKANGGFRVRFAAGATAGEWFEVYVGGNNDWPQSIEGGWAMFVVDIEEARSVAVTNGWTSTTPPATTAVRYVGIANLLTTMPKMADNTWLDAIWHNPTASPAWIVEGQDQTVSAHDWTFDDVLIELGSSSGLVIPGDGGTKTLFGPGQFGINDTTTHGFTSTNDILLWSNQEFIVDGFYGLSALGNSGGTTNVTLGVKSGTGDAATGSQGAVITAEGIGTRWFMDFNDPNLDGGNFYGCSFIHGEDFVLDDTAVSCISTLYIDCNSALVTNSEQLRISVINANTADGVAFMTTDLLTEIVFSTFNFSDGHGVELTTPNTSTHASKGNAFLGYGADGTNDAALYNNSGAGLVTINVTDGGTDITTREGASATTDVVLNPVSLTLTVLDITDQTPISGARVLVLADTTGPLPFEDSVSIVQTAGTATVTHTTHGFATNQWVLIEGAAEAGYNKVGQVTVTGANTYTYAVDSGTASPATGSPIATAAIINGTTNGSGVISDSRTYGSNQDIDAGRSKVREAAGPGFYKSAPVAGTISSANGLPLTIQMIPDE